MKNPRSELEVFNVSYTLKILQSDGCRGLKFDVSVVALLETRTDDTI